MAMHTKTMWGLVLAPRAGAESCRISSGRFEREPGGGRQHIEGHAALKSQNPTEANKDSAR